MAEFGPALRKVRDGKGMSQKELAVALGFSQNMISQWETGTREPSWSTVVGICKTLGVGCEVFMPPEAEAAEHQPAPVGRPKKQPEAAVTDAPKAAARTAPARGRKK